MPILRRNMTLADRKAYQEAVQCLMMKPSRNKDIDGARSAWDDYGVLHYKETPYVHNNAVFLLWHRHFNWVLEEDLKNLCGYTGVFPYWEWGLGRFCLLLVAPTSACGLC